MKRIQFQFRWILLFLHIPQDIYRKDFCLHCEKAHPSKDQQLGSFLRKYHSSLKCGIFEDNYAKRKSCFHYLCIHALSFFAYNIYQSELASTLISTWEKSVKELIIGTGKLDQITFCCQCFINMYLLENISCKSTFYKNNY